MKTILCVLMACALSCAAQTKAAKLDCMWVSPDVPDSQISLLYRDGHPMTYGELRKLADRINKERCGRAAQKQVIPTSARVEVLHPDALSEDTAIDKELAGQDEQTAIMVNGLKILACIGVAFIAIAIWRIWVEWL